MFKTFISTASACAAFAGLCLLAPVTANAQTFSLNAPNCTGGFSLTGSPPNQVLNCLSGGSVAPGGCTLTPANTTLAAGGGNVTLTALCTSGTLPINFTLAGGPFNGQTGVQSSANVGAQFTANVTASTTIGGSASNGSSAGLANAAITVGSSGGGGGGGAGFANCTNQGFTAIPAGGATVTWGTGMQAFSSQAGTFGDGNSTVWVFKIAVPAGTPNTTVPGRFTVAEFGSFATSRQMTVSTLPCDFRPRDINGNNGPLAVQGDGTTVSLYWGVGAHQSYWAGMTAGQTYYISVRNWGSGTGNSCGGNCTALMSIVAAAP